MVDKKKALITGITGQDGSYLAELLLNKGYEVHGIVRRSSSFNTSRIDHIFKELNLHYGDMTDSANIFSIVKNVNPDEIYNLAAQSHVNVSFETPEYTANADAIGTLRLLEAIRLLDKCADIKFYQASSSEMFGASKEVPQKETTRFYPRSPYGVAKLYSHWITVNYREAYGIFACSGILFNHESCRRGSTFVTKKITNFVRKVRNNYQGHPLKLGNIYAQRDWGYAKEYIDAMYLIMQHTVPDDFVIATGETHTVKEFCDKAFKYIGVTLLWVEENDQTYAVDSSTQQRLIEIDEKYKRPTEVDLLMGDPNKAKIILGWEPKVKFEQLVKIMVENKDI